MTLGHTDETQRNARETTTLSVECRLAEMLAPGREERHCPKRLSWGFLFFNAIVRIPVKLLHAY